MPTLTVLLRLTCILAALTSLLLFGFGALLLGGQFESVASIGALRVEPRVRDLGDLAGGEEVSIPFSVTNSSSRPVKLLGVPGFCVPWGCVSAGDFPVHVAPRSSSKFNLRLRPQSRKSTGEFNLDVVLYTDAPGRELTPLRMTGRIVPSGER
jgi:uncharacterized protein (DUF58 family)